MNNEHLHPEGRPYTKEEFVEKIKTDKKFSERFGDLGRIYGAQWRKWRNPTITKISQELSDMWDSRTHTEIDCPIDQISELLNQLKINPDSRRLLVSAWAVHDLPNMVLPPCHYGFQVYTRELTKQERWMAYCNKCNELKTESIIGSTDDKVMESYYQEYNIPTRAISLMWNQRSVDTFLGLPFNIASYGLLLEIIAKEVNMVPDQLIGNLGDVHLYSNHIEQAREQIGRELTHEERVDIYNNIKEKKDREGNWTWETRFDDNGIPKKTREPFPLPKLTFNPIFLANLEHKGLDEAIKGEVNFKIENYQSHPTIKAPLSN